MMAPYTAPATVSALARMPLLVDLEVDLLRHFSQVRKGNPYHWPEVIEYPSYAHFLRDPALGPSRKQYEMWAW